MGSTPCCFSTNPAVWCVCEAPLEPTSPFLSFLATFSGPYGHQSGTISLVPGVVYRATPPPAAHTAVPVGHLWNASKGWRGGEKSSCPDAVFQASLAVSVTATPGELPTPQFRAEIVANAQVCSNRGPQAIVMWENRLARCKLAFPITGPQIFTPSETNLPPVCKATGETCRLVRTFSGS